MTDRGPRGGQLTVAYFLDMYPQLSETFVRLEIDELRRQGVHVLVHGLFQTGPVDEEIHWMNGAPPASRARLGLAHLALMARSPRRYRNARRKVGELRSERAKFNWRRAPWFARELLRRDVDWIHAHFAWSGAAAAAVMAELTGLPWSMTMHANDIFADRRNLERKLGWAHHLITVCDYNRRWLASHYEVARPLSIVVCGVRVPDKPPLPQERAPRRVVAVGRLIEKKGFDLLVRAAARLIPHWPSLQVEIIGDGPEHGRLVALIAEHGLQSTVLLRGPLPHDEVLEAIGKAQIFCFPGRIAADGDRDSMPVVIKEAMARGTPVVASDEVGIPEMIDSSCGWLVPPDDDAALANALHEALADPDLSGRKATTAYQRVRQRFRLEDEVAKLRAIFEA
jgi:glycosyltransferase involved in cell wall biosynthesis